MRRAAFFDRDGVINEDKGYVGHKRNFVFMDGIFDLLKTLQNNGYLLFIITNQAGIARGYYTEEDYLELTKWMLGVFHENGIDFTNVYYCPFHPVHGIGKYKKESFYRKPNPGMIFQARDDYGLDLSQSLLIGDKDSDMEAGRRAGIGQLFFLSGKYPGTESQDVKMLASVLEL